MSQALMGAHDTPGERFATSGRTMSQGMFGGIALVLGIVGLAILGSHYTAAVYLDAVAQISLGIALIVFGMALAMAYARLTARTQGAEAVAGTVAGTTGDMFLGGGAVILGVLAVLGVATAILVPVAVIVVGVGMMLNSAASVRAASLETNLTGERTPARRVSEELVFATASIRAVAGVAVSILGIIALTGANPLVLTLVAAIIAGAAMLLGSTSLSGRLIHTVVPRTA
jgi:hypothetical protein